MCLSFIKGSMKELCDGQITKVNKHVIFKDYWVLFYHFYAQIPEQEFETIFIDRCVQYNTMPRWLLDVGFLFVFLVSNVYWVRGACLIMLRLFKVCPLHLSLAITYNLVQTMNPAFSHFSLNYLTVFLCCSPTCHLYTSSTPLSSSPPTPEPLYIQFQDGTTHPTNTCTHAHTLTNHTHSSTTHPLLPS